MIQPKQPKLGINLPTTTVTQARVQLFQPTQRPTYRRGDWIETSWGRCRVTGRLGQRHADAWEAVCFCAESKREFNGRLELLIDPARVRRAMSSKGYSGAGLNTLLIDLTAALVEIDTGEGWIGSGHLIEKQFQSKLKMKPDPLTKKERSLIVVVVGEAGMTLLNKDVGRWRNPAPIARLTSGVSQAVARLVLSHRDSGRMRIDTALTAVGVPPDGVERRKARARIRGDAEGLARCGVVVSDGFVFCDRRVPQTPDESENDKKYNCSMTQSVPQPPGSVPQPPGAVPQPPGSVPQPPGGLGYLGPLGL